MELLRFYQFYDHVILDTTKGKIKLEVFDKGIVRVVYTLEQEFSSKESLMILPKICRNCDWRLNSTEEALELITEELRIRIDKKTCSFAYYNSEGKRLTKEPKHGGKSLSVVEVSRNVFDKDQKIKLGQSADGLRANAEDYSTVVDRKAYHSKLEFEWSDEEALYGLGSHEEGIMNLRGTHQYLYQQNMKAVVPMLVSTEGYGILVDSYSLMVFRDDRYGSYLWTDVEDELDYYFIYGPELDDIIDKYRKITGIAPMLPKWAFGYMQSKERYQTQEELLSILSEFRERQIPIDLIILDWMYWPNNHWGQKSFDPERFPDPREMLNEIHKRNAHFMISIWPNMSEGGDNHKEMMEQGYLLGNQSTYDAFHEKARKLYWNQSNEGLFSKGIDAWWCDCTEPFEGDWKGEVLPEPEERMLINTSESKKYLDPEYINGYSLLHSKGIYEEQRKNTSKKRVVNLTRSSYAGQHRYGTITWSGDIAASWDTLRKQIPAGLNFCMTGEPYWTNDIGAFFVNSREGLWFWKGDYQEGCKDLGYCELYVRWLQYATFLPLFRAHGTDTPREPWRFGEPGTIYYDTILKFIQLRYRLLPYIYSLAGKVTLENYTMLRSLVFDFKKDTNVFNIKDQYMFGPAFLVCPITEPMYYERNSSPLIDVSKTRRVYLPADYNWYNFWTGDLYIGGKTYDIEATLEIMPLFVRSGSIVPMGPYMQYSNEKPSAPLEIRFYQGRDGNFTLYEDEGDNYNYENGQYASIHMHWDDANSQISFMERRGNYLGMSIEREFHVVLVSPGHGIGVGESIIVDKTIHYTGDYLVVKI